MFHGKMIVVLDKGNETIVFLGTNGKAISKLDPKLVFMGEIIRQESNVLNAENPKKINQLVKKGSKVKEVHENTLEENERNAKKVDETIKADHKLERTKSEEKAENRSVERNNKQNSSPKKKKK